MSHILENKADPSKGEATFHTSQKTWRVNMCQEATKLLLPHKEGGHRGNLWVFLFGKQTGNRHT